MCNKAGNLPGDFVPEAGHYHDRYQHGNDSKYDAGEGNVYHGTRTCIPDASGAQHSIGNKFSEAVYRHLTKLASKLENQHT